MAKRKGDENEEVEVAEEAPVVVPIAVPVTTTAIPTSLPLPRPCGAPEKPLTDEIGKRGQGGEFIKRGGQLIRS
jgi:hypothetical protein